MRRREVRGPSKTFAPSKNKQIETPDTTLKQITLPTSAIEVWQARLDLRADEVQQCAKFLSRDEQNRADRFHFEHDRRRFIVARGKLRQLLSRHFQIAPAAIVFSYMKNGKPFVPGNTAEVHFNLSHSEDCALYAISSSFRLGVDIECLNHEIDCLGMARRFFTQSESAALAHLEAAHQKRAFFACWTRKEAVIKATGDGLSLPLDQFEVTVQAEDEPRLLAASTLRIAEWALYAADVGDDYVATVAAYSGNSRT